MRPSRGWFAAAVLVVGSSASCGDVGAATAPSVLERAQAFYQAAASDPAAACELLSPGVRAGLNGRSGACTGAIRHSIRPPGAEVDTQVFGSHGMVRFDNDVVFLARFDSGWLVTAAACAPVVDRPYQCEIEAR